ncbi:MAG: 2-hydroxyhepta-2,4-diene-1,7-dioate isomerase, partial [Rhodobacteraceae bacterium]|nr:2-hydroxyhepta-2,4-diene-1,7-dioate isomerase [Paracoccaceae bacterium]
MTHFASFTAAAQLHFGIVTDAGAISMNAAFPQFSSLQDVVVAGALKDLAKAAVGRA